MGCQTYGDSARFCHHDDQARKEASQEPAHRISAYLAHHRSAQPVAARTPHHFERLQGIKFLRRGLSDPQTGRARRRTYSSATELEAAEIIPRLAAASAQTFF
jgi:hypothetical protein